jgi:hypothetical protein
MPREFGEGSYHEPISPRDSHQEAEHAAHAPLFLLVQRDEIQGERSHEEMVAMIRHRHHCRLPE